MRTASPRAASLLVGLCLPVACARGGAVPAPAPAAATATPAPAEGVAGEDDRYYRRALALREKILSRASWSEFDEAMCDAGAHRVFGGDTTKQQFAEITQAVETLERIIVARGVENSLNTPAGHDLLRTVIAWEAAAARPRWDVPAGEEARPAIAAGLSGRFRNPETGKCESYVVFDTLTIVLPDEVAAFDPPKLRGTVVLAHVGEAGLNRARDAFYTKTAAEPSSIFSYVRIRAAVIWRDFAVIAVNRPVEARAMVKLPQGAGGAAYIFRRVGDEWRVLAISRTWS